ncbi:MAG: O-antigen ligase family protein [Acidobacteriaceae bacterium]|nr:O-antigen ligase family protein [Acidobacteriaceae bacterium]
MLRLLVAPRWADDPSRFTSFSPAQGFAAFLAALFCVGLAARSIRTNVRILCCSALAAALILNGSRIWFVGIVIASLLSVAISDLRPWMKICGAGLLTIMVAVLIGAGDRIIDILNEEARSNRIVAAISALYSGDVASSPLGTLRFRRGIDAAGIDQIRNASFTELVFGHGTSNGSTITGSLYRSYSRFTDPNRMVHNDWLRIIYEWGLVGFGLWCTFIVSIVLFAWKGMRLDWAGNSRPLLVYIPAFLTCFAAENFLAGAGSAATNGLLLLIAFATVSHRYVRHARVMQAADAVYFRDELHQELLSGSAG